MGQLKFDAITGKLLPQKISYNIKHEEAIEEMLEECIKKGKVKSMAIFETNDIQELKIFLDQLEI